MENNVNNIYNGTQQDKSTAIRIHGIIAEKYTVVTVVVTLVLAFCVMKAGEANNFFEALISGAFAGFLIGGMIPGYTHIKAVYNKIKKLLYIFPVGWAIFMILLLAVPCFGGWIFMLYDLVKFNRMKKANN